MVPVADGIIWLVFCFGLLTSPGSDPPASTLRTFLVDKAPESPAPDPAAMIRAAQGLSTTPPIATSRLHALVGVGYVQYADWGTEGLVSGSIAGLDVQADSLFTFGPQGPLFDHGTIALRHPTQRWLAEGGDLFSDLRGPATGLRLSWQVTD